MNCSVISLHDEDDSITLNIAQTQGMLEFTGMQRGNKEGRTRDQKVMHTVKKSSHLPAEINPTLFVALIYKSQPLLVHGHSKPTTNTLAF